MHIIPSYTAKTINSESRIQSGRPWKQKPPSHLFHMPIDCCPRITLQNPHNQGSVKSMLYTSFTQNRINQQVVVVVVYQPYRCLPKTDSPLFLKCMPWFFTIIFFTFLQNAYDSMFLNERDIEDQVQCTPLTEFQIHHSFQKTSDAVKISSDIFISEYINTDCKQILQKTAVIVRFAQSCTIKL